jgi:hypothetical protein
MRDRRPAPPARARPADNPITSLPSGPDCFRTLEVLSIGQTSSDVSANFVANLDLAQFPWLRVLEQQYKPDEIAYRDSQDLWDNPHLEILNLSWPALKHGIPAGLLRARNLRALATEVNAVQLGSFLWRGPAFERLEYLAIGYSDLSRKELARLYDGLPRAFISSQYVDGKSDFDLPEYQRLSDIDNRFRRRQFTEALADLDDMAAARNLRRPFLPLDLHAKLMTLAVEVRRVAAEEDQDRGRREAMAEAALSWADRVLSVLPENAEACWYLDYHRLWLVRLQCLYARATGLTLRAAPDPAAARAALDLAQRELDRFLLPVNPHWHGNETALVRQLRARVPV